MTAAVKLTCLFDLIFLVFVLVAIDCHGVVVGAKNSCV